MRRKTQKREWEVVKLMRIALLALGSLFSPLLPWVLVILLVGTHGTALQRILFVRNALKKS